MKDNREETSIFYHGRSRLSKNIVGVGYIGIGPHTSSEGGRNCKAYQCWSNMIKRCYAKSICRKNKSYEDCFVDESWHNYQNFADWYYKNHPNDGLQYHLDKDTKIKGNRTYSPDACQFISPKLNLVSNQKTYMLDNVDGDSVVVSNLKEFCRQSGLNHNSMYRMSKGNQLSHKGWIKVRETTTPTPPTQ